jgi:hypothetical protein
VAPDAKREAESRQDCGLVGSYPIRHAEHYYAQGKSGTTAKRVPVSVRTLSKLYHYPILLWGTCWVVIDTGTAIQNALLKDLKHPIPPRTFPIGTLMGLPCLWLGYRLLFTKPVMPRMLRPKQAQVSN